MRAFNDYRICLLFLVLASGCGNWNYHSESQRLPEGKTTTIESVTTQQLTNEGEVLMFGGLGKSRDGRHVGKAQCPVCHAFHPRPISERGPNLWGITARQRTKPTSLEYLAESHVCPNCYVVAGWGQKGSRDCESPMPKAHLPPINLTIKELVAIDTWIYVHEGKPPPSPHDIRTTYRNLLSQEEWSYINRDSRVTHETERSEKHLFLQHACAGCHIIPTIPAATGTLGPPLYMKTNASTRLNDPAYKGNASSPREYIIESILHHDVYIVTDNALYAQTTLSSSHYEDTISTTDLEQMVNYLQNLEEDEHTQPTNLTRIERCLQNKDS